MSEFYNLYGGGICWSKDPLIVQSIDEDLAENLDKLGKNVFFLKVLNCGYTLDSFRKMVQRFKRLKNVVLYICCNTQSQYDLLKKEGYPYLIYFNRNALINEDDFFIDRSISTKYDLVYIAQMHSTKNLHIYNRLKGYSKFLVTYQLGSKNNANLEEYLKEPIDPRLEYNRKFIHNPEIRKILNSSRIGLNLITKSGGVNRGLAECFLCGLPMITTHGEWENSEFYDSSLVEYLVFKNEKEIILEVDQAVEKISKKEIDRELIRSSVIEKLKNHRECLIESIQNIDSRFSLNNFFDNSFKFSAINSIHK